MGPYQMKRRKVQHIRKTLLYITLSKGCGACGEDDEVMQIVIPDDNLGAYEEFVPVYTPRPHLSVPYRE